MNDEEMEWLRIMDAKLKIVEADLALLMVTMKACMKKFEEAKE